MFQNGPAQENWQIFRLAIVAVFHNHKDHVRGAYSPCLHFMAVHSGVSSATLVLQSPRAAARVRQQVAQSILRLFSQGH